MVGQLMSLTDMKDRAIATFALESAGYDLAAAVSIVFEMGTGLQPPSAPSFYETGSAGSMHTLPSSLAGFNSFMDHVPDIRAFAGGEPDMRARDVFDEDGVRQADNVKRQRLLGSPAGAPGAGYGGGYGAYHDPSLPAPRGRKNSAFASGESLPANVSEKEKTLKKMYAPPQDLMMQGSLEEVRDLCKAHKPAKWLLINIQQDDEFKCQVLNRDVWSNEDIKEVVRTSFLFWQQLYNSDVGKHFVGRYKAVSFPYLAIVDPRTGAAVETWKKIQFQMEDVYSWLIEFCGANPFPGHQDKKPSASSSSSSGGGLAGHGGGKADADDEALQTTLRLSMDGLLEEDSGDSGVEFVQSVSSVVGSSNVSSSSSGSSSSASSGSTNYRESSQPADIPKAGFCVSTILALEAEPAEAVGTIKVKIRMPAGPQAQAASSVESISTVRQLLACVARRLQPPTGSGATVSSSSAAPTAAAGAGDAQQPRQYFDVEIGEFAHKLRLSEHVDVTGASLASPANEPGEVLKRVGIRNNLSVRVIVL